MYHTEPKKQESMKKDKEESSELTNMRKWKYTLITTVIFLLITNPYTYILVNKLTQNVFGKVCSPTGCPTTFGLLLHAVVFTLFLRGVMELKI